MRKGAADNTAAPERTGEEKPNLAVRKIASAAITATAVQMGSGRRQACRSRRGAYFFTHLDAEASHFMVVTFSHSAFVFGAFLACARGAAKLNRMQARMVVPSIFVVLGKHSMGLRVAITRGGDCSAILTATSLALYGFVTRARKLPAG
jgi:hypothetical protein